MFTREPDGDIPQLEACQIQYPFTESKFEESEVRKLLLSINPNKSPGPDGLHPLLPGSVLAPFLNNTTMFPSFHIFGTIPVSFDTLNIIVRGSVITLVKEILDNGGSIDSVYMDFMKAFDKVPHKRLIKNGEVWH
jgi:hypothetical protein